MRLASSTMLSPAPPTSRRRPGHFCTTLLLILLAVVATAAVLLSRPASSPPSTPPPLPPPTRPATKSRPRPLLVIDAGSSGTRVHAFRVELDDKADRASAAPPALGRRGGPKTTAATTTPPHHHHKSPYAIRALRLVPASAAPAARPAAGDGKRGMYERVETRPGLDQVVAALGHDAADPRADAAAVERALRTRALGPLLDWAAAALRETSSASNAAEKEEPPAPVFFGGTGGLRRMPAAERERLLDAARRVLRSDARLAGTLPGAREAAYGWVATNWVRGLLRPPAEREAKQKEQGGNGGSATGAAAEADEPTTVGVLDLGGASLEVAFEVSGDEEQGHQQQHHEGDEQDPFARPASPVVELRVGGWRGRGALRRVHTHAFHGYGLNEAFDRAVTRLLEEQQQQHGATKEQKELAGVGVPEEGSGARRRRRRRLSQDVAAAPPVRLSLDGAAARRPDGAGAGGAADGGAALSAPRPPTTPPPPIVVRHPCLHAGYEAPYERIAHRHSHHADPELAASGQPPASEDGSSDSNGGSNSAPPPPPPPSIVTLVGAPDWPACRRLMSAVVDAHAPCARHPHGPGEECRLGSLQPPVQPPPSAAGTRTRRRRYAALSGFDAVWRFLGADPRGGTAALLRAAERWCAAPWPLDTGLAAELHPGAGGAAGAVNAERYCGWAPYAASLLTEGLGLEDGDFDVGGDGGGGGAGGGGSGAAPSASSVAPKDGDEEEARLLSKQLASVGWPLGAALVEGPRLLAQADGRELLDEEGEEEQHDKEAVAAGFAGSAGGSSAVASAGAAPRSLRARRSAAAVVAAGALLLLVLVVAAVAASSSSSSSAARGSPPRKGGGPGSLLPLQAAPSMVSLRQSSFAVTPSSPGSPAYATSSSFSFSGSTAAAAAAAVSSPATSGAGGGLSLQLPSYAAATRRGETSPTLWRPQAAASGGSGGVVK